MPKYIVEFIGTFFLVLTIALAVASGSVLAPIAIGAMLMVMVYLGAHISGAHYNPAVTAAVLLRGKCAAKDAGPYIATQILAAFAAAALAHVLTGKVFFAEPGKDVSMGIAIAGEAVFTFALASVVLHVATHRKTAGNGFYGVAIGFTVAASAVAIGPVSGGALNPAVGLGPALYALVRGIAVPSSVFIIYTVGPLIGGVLAAVAFNAVKGTEAD